MDNYDPAARIPGLRDVVIAWLVAIAICAILLTMPEFGFKPEESNGKAGLDVAIDEALPRDTNLLAERQSLR